MEADVDLSDYIEEYGEDELEEIDDTADIPELKINKTILELKIGKEKTLKVSDPSQKVKWESSNTDIATVSKEGEVKGKKYGTVTVKAISSTQQAVCKVIVYASKKHISQWIEKDGRCYYYGKYGQKVTGRKEIGDKTYYFDKKGRQRTGWIKTGKSYYYYNIAKGRKGHLVKNKTVNQIKILKSGKVKITAKNKTKAYILARSNDIVFENTNWKMTKSEALKKLFAGFAESKSISYKNIGHFKKEGNWPERYAMIYLNNGYGDCYTAGSMYAYLAVALGCREVYAQSSGGHGWCKINGKYYDPNWAFWGTKNMDNAFAVPEVMSGRGGRPNWKRAALYSIKIS